MAQVNQKLNTQQQQYIEQINNVETINSTNARKSYLDSQNVEIDTSMGLNASIVNPKVMATLDHDISKNT